MINSSEKVSHIVLVLNPGLTFHREIITGIGAFAQATGLKWAFEVETNILKTLVADRLPDGFIVDGSATEEVELLASLQKYPFVCVSSAVSVPCPAGISNVASDSHALIDAALRHLKDAGIVGFAFYSRPKYSQADWAIERGEAFAALVPRPEGMYVGAEVPAGNAAAHAENLQAWLRSLPVRTGIVAVNDSSARELLHACQTVGRRVPEDIAIVGIDNDPLVAAMAPLPISSVIQGSHEMGRKAAELLHERMCNQSNDAVLLRIPPRGVQPAATSPKTCPALRDALEFIAGHATQGIKVEQVADHLGISRTSLERLFREHLGYTAHDEMLRTRLAQAKQLLLSRTISTAEVARRCGFRTQQYMHVVFKRELGLSPTEYVARAVTENKAA